MNCAIYARVSTSDQNCELQLRELRDYCARRGWEIGREYVDTGWSGTKASRPELDRLMADARQHKFGCVLVWKLDRFSRSMSNLVEQLRMLESYGVRWMATSQGLDTDASNPTSRLLLHILAAVAEFERELIKERVKVGVSAYREMHKQGRIGKERSSRSGKNLPVGRPKKVFDRARVTKLHAQGKSQREIAAALKIGLGTVHRILAAAAV